MKKSSCHVSFRFGNSSSVIGKQAVYFPIGNRWMKVIVVPSNTPFLIANSVFRSLDAIIDTKNNQIHFKAINKIVPIHLTDRKLYQMDLLDLLIPGHRGTSPQENVCAAEAATQETTAEISMPHIPSQESCPGTLQHDTKVSDTVVRLSSPRPCASHERVLDSSTVSEHGPDSRLQQSRGSPEEGQQGLLGCLSSRQGQDHADDHVRTQEEDHLVRQDLCRKDLSRDAGCSGLSQLVCLEVPLEPKCPSI